MECAFTRRALPRREAKYLVPSLPYFLSFCARAPVLAFGAIFIERAVSQELEAKKCAKICRRGSICIFFSFFLPRNEGRCVPGKMARCLSCCFTTHLFTCSLPCFAAVACQD